MPLGSFPSSRTASGSKKENLKRPPLGDYGRRRKVGSWYSYSLEVLHVDMGVSWRDGLGQAGRLQAAGAQRAYPETAHDAYHTDREGCRGTRQAARGRGRAPGADERGNAQASGKERHFTTQPVSLAPHGNRFGG